MALSTSCPLPSLSPKTSLGKRRGGRESSDGSPARQLVSSRPFPALLALQTAIPTHQGCPAPQSGGWQPATLTPDFTWFPPSRAQGSPVFSPLNLGRGPCHGPPSSPVLTLLKRYPHISTAYALTPTPPPPQRHNTNTHAPSYLGEGGPWKEAPWTAQLLREPEPRSLALLWYQPQFPHFPGAVSHPAPCTSASEEVAQSPGSCTCGQALLTAPSRKASLTHKSTQHTGTPSSNLTHPGLQAWAVPLPLPA